MRGSAKGIFIAMIAAALLGSVAMAQTTTQFDLHVNPQFAACLGKVGGPTPTAHVTVAHGNINDTLTIVGDNMRPHLGFDMFTVERSNLLADGTVDPAFPGSFGMAWYQSDLQADAKGHFQTTIKTVLVNEVFGFDPDVALSPTNTFHLGFWFDDPKDANVNGCVFDVTKPTPFNGEHDAGPLAMISVPNGQTLLGPLCTSPILPPLKSNGVLACNP